MASDDIEGGAGEAPAPQTVAFDTSPAPQTVAFDGVEQGGAGGGINIISGAVSLSKVLFFEGTSVVALGIGSLVKPPKGHWSRSTLLPRAYYPAGVVLSLSGMWLLKLSFSVTGNPNRRTLAKAAMLATFAPLLLVIALRVLANSNMSPWP